MSTPGDYLELAVGSGPPQRLPLEKGRVQIGRSTTCEIRLGGGYVSRRHARLEREANGAWRIMDLGSSNGTHVNGRRIQVASLSDADVVAIGTHRLTFHTSRDSSAPTGVTTAVESEREIVPAGLTSMVVDGATLPPDHTVPARLLAEVHEAGRRLSRLGDVPSLLAAVAEDFRSILHPQRIAIGREDGPQPEWPVVIGPDGQPADGSDLSFILVPRVDALHSSMAVSWEELGSERPSGSSTARARSLLFPISAGSRRFGHVYVELAPGHPAPDETIELLSLFTRQTALVWENLQLQDARRAADQLNHELNAARQIQLQLFPDRRSLDPRIELAAENVPALGVSGDYYDYQLLAPGRIAFIVADVMGHGLSAALLMASVQAVFRTGVRAGWDIPQLDQRLHELVVSSGQGELFVTGLLGVCDLAEHRIELLSAGHTWPSICCNSRLVERDEAACDLPWGIEGSWAEAAPSASPVAERSGRPAVVDLAPGGWSVVAYTDGVSEATLPGGGIYGNRRVADIHRQHHDRAADELCEEILSDVLRSSDDSSPQQDDITLLVLRSSTRSRLRRGVINTPVTA